MSKERSAVTDELQDILRRLEAAQQELIDAVARVTAPEFEREHKGGEPIKRVLERAADDVNFYYGRLVAKAVSLPQPPYMKEADFSSLSEAKASLGAAHRQLSNLLHDLRASDLERPTRLESTSELTLRQVLETTIAHYRLRTSQIANARRETKKRGSRSRPRRRS